MILQHAIVLQQPIIKAELEKLHEAAAFINSLFGTMVILQEVETKDEVLTMQITVPNYDVFFALAVQYGKNIEKGNVKQYIKAMFEEMADVNFSFDKADS
jgi:hypothetical protein